MPIVKYYGHSFAKIDLDETSIIVDPFFNCENAKFKRLIACQAKLKELSDVSIILITQEGFDHFDNKAVTKLAIKNNAHVLATQNILNELNIPQKLKVPVAGHETKMLKEVKIEIFPSHLPRSFYPVNYLIRKGKKSVYHAGGSNLIPLFDSIKTETALLPIGGGRITMDVVDAVKATKSMKPKYVVPIQYNTFDFLKADPGEFVYKIEKSILKTKPVVLNPGQKFEWN